MKKLWYKFHPKKPTRGRSQSGSGGDYSSDFNRTTNDGMPGASSSVFLESGFVQSQDLQQSPPSSALIATSIPNNRSKCTGIDPPSVSGINSSPWSENNPGWKTTASSGARMALEVLKESSDVFTPLKSVVGGLSMLLTHYDRYISNKDDVQRLILRVDSLATSLAGPSPDGDFKEITRRKFLESDLKKILDTLNKMVNQSKLSGFVNNANQAAEITGLVEDVRNIVMHYQTSLQQDLIRNTITLIESMDLILLDKLRRSEDAAYLCGDRQKCFKGTRVGVLETIENWIHENNIRRVYWLNGPAGSGKATIAHSLAERLYAEGDLGASFFCSRDFADRRNLHFIFPTLAFQLAYKYPAFRAHLVTMIKSNPDVCRSSLENQLKELLIEPLQSTGLATVIIIDALDECDDREPASAILSLLSRKIDQIPSVKLFITGRPEPRLRSGFRLPGLNPQTEVLLLHEVARQDVGGDIKLFLEYHLKELVKNRSDVDLTTPWPAPDDVLALTSKAGGLFIYASTVIKFVASISHKPRDRLRLITSLPHSTAYEGKLEIDPLYAYVLYNGCSHVDPDDSEFFSILLLVVSACVLLWEPISVGSLAKMLGLQSDDIFTPIRSLHSVLLVPDSDSRPIRVFHKSFPDYITDSKRCQDTRFYVDSKVHHGTLGIQCLELMKTGLKKNICNLPQYVMNDDIDDLQSRRDEYIAEVLVYACRFWSKHICSSSGTGDKVGLILMLLNEFIRHQLLQWLEVLSIVKDLRGAVHSLRDVERWLLGIKPSDEDLVGRIRECLRFTLYSFDCIEQSAPHIYDSALIWSPTSSLVRTLYLDQSMMQARVLNGSDDSWGACIRSIRLGDMPVFSIAFSHGGDTIAGCSGSVITLLEAATGACLATLSGHDENVTSIAFSFDDALLASGSDDGTVTIWDVQTGAAITRLEGHTDWVLSVAFSPIGTAVASGARDDTVRIWNLSSGSCDCILSHSAQVRSVCWLQQDKLVSGGWDMRLNIWDVSSGERLQTIDCGFAFINHVSCSPTFSKIASGSSDKMIKVYNALTGDLLQTVEADNEVASVSFSPDGEKVAYTTDTSVVVFDLVKEVSTFEWQSGSPCGTFSPDGGHIAVGSWAGLVKVFQMDTWDRDVCDKYSEKVSSVSFSADGRMIVSGSGDGTVKLWDAATGSCVQSFHGHTDWIGSVTFSPDSTLFASGSNDKTVRIWSTDTSSDAMNSCLHMFQGHTDPVRCVAISPDSSFVASGSNCLVRIWGLHDRDFIEILEGHSDWVYGVCFSPDGRRIASVSEYQGVILWDVDKFVALGVWPSSGDYYSNPRISFSTDGDCIILECHDAVQVWKIQSSSLQPSEHAGGLLTSEPSSEAVSFPIVLVPLLDGVDMQNDIRLYRCLREAPWVLDRNNRHVCWIPADWRGIRSDSHEQKVVWGTPSGSIFIIDFSDTSVF